jgi:hypothetical protein
VIFVAALLVSLKGTGSNVWSLFRSRAATFFVQGRKTIAAMTKEQAKPLESVASSWNKRIQIDQKNMNILNTYRSYSVNSVIIYRGINMCQLSTTTEWTATANQQKSARDFTEFWESSEVPSHARRCGVFGRFGGACDDRSTSMRSPVEMVKDDNRMI